MDDLIKVKRALISVSDKTGLVEFAKKLSLLNIEIISTGGTSEILREAKIQVKDVSEITKFPEILDGRVKTLHPNIHGGLLADSKNLKHINSLKELNIIEIDLVVVNLYPFEKFSKNNFSEDECIENIDIGGPAMIRAASKNYKNKLVVIDQNDYDKCYLELKNNNGFSSLTFRKSLAQYAFSYVSNYDSLISNWMIKSFDIDTPKILNISGFLRKKLRYGENPHQKASIYLNSEPFFTQIQGKELSYNNINDIESAFHIVNEFRKQKKIAVSIIKHSNPCGVATSNNSLEAYKKALSSDPESAFGGIVSFNSLVDENIALEIIKIFTEVIVAPDFSDSALKIFKEKKNLRLIKNRNSSNDFVNEKVFKSLKDGFILQDKDKLIDESKNFKIVTKKKPNESELNDLLFAFETVKHVKSNGIVIAKDNKTLGIGAGQMSRIESVIVAKRKSLLFSKRENIILENIVLASDAFFPFSDSISAISNSGITSIIQPGGSMRDKEVIDAADAAGISMIFTGKRHFLH